MRASLAALHGTELHGGNDLESAYPGRIVSAAGGQRRAQPLSPVVRALRAVATDASNVDPRQLRAERFIVSGKERVSSSQMNVVCKGRPETLAFVIQHLFGSDDFERLGRAEDSGEEHDLFVTDRRFTIRYRSALRHAMLVPRWIRQRLALSGTWPDTLDRLPRHLRKELRRQLRKGSYHARVESRMSARLQFYDQHLVPYVKRRFGDNAVLRGKRAFRREVDGSVLLELRDGDSFLGASLLSLTDDVLSIGGTALCSDHAVPSDVLDYFCLVLAQCVGCRWLDLGLTRPHLEDGIFAYKAKWRPSLLPVGPLKSPIRILPLRSSPAVTGFFSRNGFLERRGDGFIVRRLNSSGEPSQTRLSELSLLAQRSGLDELIVACSGCGGALPKVAPEHARLLEFEPGDGLIDAFLRST